MFPLHGRTGQRTLSKREAKENLDRVNSAMGAWLSNTKQRFTEVAHRNAGGLIRNTPFWSVSDDVELGDDEIPGDITLVTQFFIGNNAARINELQTALKVNAANPCISQILLLNERLYTAAELGIDSPKIRQIVINRRLDYKTVFDVVEQERVSGYIVLSNLDIFFDKSLEVIRKTGIAQEKAMFCLLRYEFKLGRPISQSPLFEYQSNSQDTWIWHSNFNPGVKERSVCDFNLGTPGCDNTFLYLAHLFGYKVYNLPGLIKSYHNHATNIRNYNDATPRTPKPFFYCLAKTGDNIKQDPSHPFTFVGENKNFCDFLDAAFDNMLPFVVPRLAGIEHMYAVMGAQAGQRGRFEEGEANFLNQTRSAMKNNAGIFLPDANSVVRYSEAYMKAFHSCEGYFDWEPQGDVANAYGGALQNAFEFAYINFNRQRFWSFGVADIFHVVNQEKPWTHCLSGQRILVISPFADTFEKQVPVLDKIYGRDLFPGCTFTFMKPPVTNGNNPARPFDIELNDFAQRIEKIKDSFDVALVSCGGYGNPILGRIFEMGKSGIYIGGVLQMYFGVYGSRWERERPLVMKLFKNDHWVRPAADERPQGFENIEQSCYW